MMKKAALYPFNKITQGLIRFRDLLAFELASVIDFVLHPGEDAGELVDGSPSGIRIHRSIADGLEGVDTLILNDPGTFFGANKQMFDAYDLPSLWRQLILEANQRGIAVISVHEIYDAGTLDWAREQGVSIRTVNNFDPEVFRQLHDRYDTSGSAIESYLKHFELDRMIFGPGRRIKRVGIFATRGCIGKFTTQMNLFRAMRAEGVKVTALITEPTGFLFNQPEGDIFKFLAHQPLDKYPYYLDAVVRKAEEEGSEWMLMAGQSSILPTNNIVFTSVRYAMLQAFNPDFTLLIVGYDDDEQVRDAMELLRLFARKPLALLLPDKVETSYGHYEAISDERRRERRDALMDKFGVPVEPIDRIEAVAALLRETAQG